MTPLNCIFASWQSDRVGLTAEQDNRVRIPDGTAAVYAEVFSMTKVGHWGHPGKAEKTAGAPLQA